MTRPIGYKVPTFIESASEAMAEWKKWVAYANALEEDKARLAEALKNALTTIEEDELLIEIDRGLSGAYNLEQMISMDLMPESYSNGVKLLAEIGFEK